MFSGVRQNNSFYILEKQDGLKLKVGQVVSVSNPQSVFGQPYGSEQYVDVVVKVDGETMEFKKLPASLSIADSGEVVVSDNKEVMNNEVESIQRSSQQLLSKVEYHTKVVDDCNSILRVLNPTLAKEQERDEDINNLKSKIGGLEDKMDEILNILSRDRSK